jgi:hypothetical protein
MRISSTPHVGPVLAMMAALLAVGVAIPGPSSGSEPSHFSDTQGLLMNDVTVAPNGDVYVDPNQTGEIRRYSAAGQLLSSWTAPSGYGFLYLEASPGGVYALDGNNQDVISYSATGAILWKRVGASGEGIGDMVSDGSNLFVAQAESNRILVLDPGTGAQRAVWSVPRPRGLASAPSGGLYVLEDTGQRPVVQMDSSGTVTRTLFSVGQEGGNYPSMQVDSSGHLLVDQGFGSSGGQIGIYNTDGSVAGTIPTPATVTNQDMTGFDVGAGDKLYACLIGHPSYGLLETSATPPPTPSGPIGVSINDGASATNSTRVTLNVSWPRTAQSILVSNDGGFKNPQTFPLATTIPWTLPSTGAERLPKIVYVRFQDGTNSPVTFSDDIILDETAPQVTSATTTPSSPTFSPQFAGSRKDRSVTIAVHAIDDNSGIAAVQLRVKGARTSLATMTLSSRTRTGRRVINARVHVRTRARSLEVRVRDSAGNWSRWVTVTRVRTR